MTRPTKRAKKPVPDPGGWMAAMPGIIKEYRRIRDQTKKPTRPKPSPTVQAYRLLKKLRDQLKAMNSSPAHAVSWVEPNTDTTTKRIRQIDRLLRSMEEGAG